MQEFGDKVVGNFRLFCDWSDENHAKKILLKFLEPNVLMVIDQKE